MTRTKAAAAVSSDLIRFALAGFLALALTSFLVTQAMAQKTPGGAPSPALVTDAVDICGIVVNEPLEDAEAELANLGWSLDYSEPSGAFVWEINASKIYDDGTDVYLFALLELYPTGLIGYCTFDAQAVPGRVDLNAVADVYGVPGTIEETDVGIYGAWEEIGDGGIYYVLANQDYSDNYFFLQMTFIVPPDTEAMGSGGGAAK